MKTKILLCLILVLSGLHYVQGQSLTRHILRVGVGTHAPYLGEGTGMKGGIAFSSEYLRAIKKRFYLGASAHYLTRHEGFKNEININTSDIAVPGFLKNKRVQHESIVAGFANAIWAPLDDSRSLFLIGAGAGVQYKMYTQFWTYSNTNGYLIESRRRIALSGNLLISYDYKLSQHFSLGLRQHFLIDGEFIPLLTVGVGGRF